MKRWRWRTGVLGGILALGLVWGVASRGLASEPPLELGPQSEPSDPAQLLRRAHRALEAGEYARARRALEQVSAEHPVVADYADLARAESLLAEGDFEAAESQLALLPARHPKSPLQPEFYKNHGDALRELKNEAGAREAWLKLLVTPRRSRSEQAELWAEMAQSHGREGDPELARDAYLEIWTRFPDQTERATEATIWLDVYEEGGGAKSRTAIDFRRRGDQLFHNREFEAALEAYDRSLEMDPSPDAVREIRKRRGDTFFRLRRYAEAERAYARYGGSLIIAHSHPLALARSGRVPEAIDSLLARAKAKEEKNRSGERALYTAALLLEGEGRSEEAWRLFERVAKDARRPVLRRAALWFVGWNDYLAGRYRDAASRFERLAGLEPTALLALRPRYWRARALERAGEPEERKEAAAEYRSLSSEFPLSYYGWRASQRVSEEGSELPQTALQVREPVAFDAGSLDRVRILLAAGMNEEALSELRRSLPGVASTVEERAAYAALAQALGEYNLAQGGVLRGNGEWLARGPQRHGEDLWWHAWPRAYAFEVDGGVAQVQGRVRPELAFAIIREESGYRPEVVSGVGARGLMQIMVATGQDLARARGMDPLEAADLFDPALNVELGIQYLADLAQRFPDHPAAAIASYNAGPHVVAKWPGLEDLEEDEWVETIPYEQTRQYVKRVMRSQFVYDTLYPDD